MGLDLKLFSDGPLWDLQLTNGDLSFVTGAEQLQQKLKQKLWLLLGEWFRDITAGVDYYGSVLIKNPDLVTFETLIRTEIMEEDHVVDITSFELTFDGFKRNAMITTGIQSDFIEDKFFTFKLNLIGEPPNA